MTAAVICETSRDEELPEKLSGFYADRVRNYGKTKITLYTHLLIKSILSSRENTGFLELLLSTKTITLSKSCDALSIISLCPKVIGRDEELPEKLSGFYADRVRNYGKTKITLYRRES